MTLRGRAAAAAVELGRGRGGPPATPPALPPVRVGVHTGPAVSRDGDWYGTTVNVAARLCSAAGGGEVLVSEATRSAGRLGSQIVLGERRLHWLKNLSRPIAAHVATARAVP